MLPWQSLDGLRRMAYTGRVDRDGGRLEALGFCFYPFSGNPPSRGEQSPRASLLSVGGFDGGFSRGPGSCTEGSLNQFDSGAKQQPPSKPLT